MASKAGAPRRHSLVWLQGLGCGAVVALLPAMALLGGVLLLPGVLALLYELLYDRQGGRPVVRAVLLAGAAAVVRPAIVLWNAGNSMDACLALLGDVRVVGTAWSAAAAGWLAAELAPIVVLTLLEAGVQTKAARLRAERERLVAEWGFDLEG
jgi:hypothetical protein